MTVSGGRDHFAGHNAKTRSPPLNRYHAWKGNGMSEGVIQETAIDGETASLQRRAEPRPLYYGWVMVPLSMATLIASSPGQTFGISIFNEPMRASLGLSHGQSAAAYMLGTLLGALPITYIGRQMDRHGLRRTLLTVITLFCFACVLTAFVQGWWGLVAAFCMLRMLGPGALALLSGTTLAFWFERNLGMVEGIRKVGMASAMASIPAFNLWLVHHWGWRGAYAILGAGIWLVLFPLIMFLFRNRPADVGQLLDGAEHPPAGHSRKTVDDAYWGFTLSEVLRMKSFWIVASGTATCGLVHTALFFCMVPIFQERGLSARDAAATLTTFAVCLAIMQLVGGFLADRVPARILLTTGMLNLSAAITLFFVAESLAVVLAGGAVLGAGQGIFFGVAQPLWARYFGRRHLGKIRGLLMTINVASSSLGPLIAGFTRDWRGDFTLALLLFAIAPIPIGLLSLLVKAPVHRGDEYDGAIRSCQA